MMMMTIMLMMMMMMICDPLWVDGRKGGGSIFSFEKKFIAKSLLKIEIIQN
jgi:hypothetical protein